ncbi:hypothetical protein [Deinococcus detaillensis]|uniref:hypothetical protein n=1 Tax=Deinococcus detaillensis TaxID=2592048 RepID=UPI00163DB65D|nr:hypothetical protein [Deinococcus detaillensis]
MNQRTERRYFVRVPVEACWALPVASLAASVKARRRTAGELEALTDIVARAAVDWNPEANTFRVVSSLDTELEPGWNRVQLTTAPTGRSAARLWLVCPRCAGRVGAVYASHWNAAGGEVDAPLIGCRTCLGLTDGSRQQHKTLAWSYEVMGLSRPTPGKAYRPRRAAAIRRAVGVFDRRWARALRAVGIEI